MSVAGIITLLQTTAEPVAAQSRSISLIRDAEIERNIRSYVTPIYDAAGLDPDALNIHIVQDNSLNAFVAGGQRIFVHTGLLVRADNPGQVIGVLAHETGHITGGHLARIQNQLASARAESIAALVLGVVAGLATGDPRAGVAVNALGQTAATAGLLEYSRTQESSADAAALRFLDETGMSSRGLVEFLDILARREGRSVGRETVYLRTHPLTADRVAAVTNHLQLSRYADTPWPPELVEKQDRMRAKLIAFLGDLEDVERRYPDPRETIAAGYAHAIARFRRGELDIALPLIDSLIAQEPANPFFYELKGQMLFENGRIAEAVAPYAESVRLAPDEPLLLTSLAQVQIETGDRQQMDLAKDHLRVAVSMEPRLGAAWRQKAIVHGRLGETSELALAMAEMALLRGEYNEAQAHAERAENALPVGSPGQLRALDIQSEVKRAKDRK